MVSTAFTSSSDQEMPQVVAVASVAGVVLMVQASIHLAYSTCNYLLARGLHLNQIQSGFKPHPDVD